MKGFLATFAPLSILALACTPTLAQTEPPGIKWPWPWAEPVRLSGPTYLSVWNLKVGSAAIYDLKLPSGTKSTLELAVVGEESVSGKNAYWVEISSPTEGESAELVVKMLLYLDVRPGQPAHNPVSWLISDTAPKTDVVTTNMVFQRPGYPPIDVPNGMTAYGAANTPEFVGILSGWRFIDSGAGEWHNPFAREENMRVPKTKLLGKEDVATPARTFSCDHLRFLHGAGDIWITPKAPPFGLVKAVAKDHTTMVLTGLLSNAKDKITATPVRVAPKQVADLTGDLWFWIEAIAEMPRGLSSARTTPGS